MTTSEKIKILKKHLEEVIGTDEEITNLLESDLNLNHYIGCEISGKVHLGTGLMSMQVIKDLQKLGVKTQIWLADYHTWINDKLGGDLDVIRGIGTAYFIEAFKASAKCYGVDPESLVFRTGLEEYKKDSGFWDIVIDVSKNTTLSRMERSISIAGRDNGKGVDFAKLLYPAMQVADIWLLDAHFAHAGMDQRKAHVIARDVAKKLKIKKFEDVKGNTFKPIALHHSLLLGLGKPSQWPLPEGSFKENRTEFKMSKSKPHTAIFITDNEEQIRNKIKKAFCMEGEVTFNAILNWAKHLLNFDEGHIIEVKRPEKYGGDKTYTDYATLEKDFADKSLHPMDLKQGFADTLVSLLAPAREHFSKGEPKRLVEEMEKIVLTR